MIAKKLFLLSIALVFISVAGCDGGGSPVTILKENGYYSATIDLTSISHKDMGTRYATEIKNNVTDFEKNADVALSIMLSGYFVWLDVLGHAEALYSNASFNPDYKAEIEGMQEVFNSNVDLLGDGILSKNELLVFQFVPDVVRNSSCSASSAFGNASTAGKTIVGRNLDWSTVLDEQAGNLHAITTFKNGNKRVVNVGTIGQLGATTIWNRDKLFGAIINADTGAPYPEDLSNRRAFIFDLRYAFEKFSTMEEISAFMSSSEHLYVYNHIIFLADENSAGAVENQVNNISPSTGNRSLRIDSSELNPDLLPTQTWGILGALAAVNDYRLPNNNFTNSLRNNSRWTSFVDKYSGISSGGTISVDSMKAIQGYAGPNDSGYSEEGAIFISETTSLSSITTIQSIIMDMNSMDLWVHFVPSTTTPPRSPTYQKIENPIY